jgi:hypothetical protein
MAGTPVYVNGAVNRTIAALARYLPYRAVAAAGRRFGGLYRTSSP